MGKKRKAGAVVSNPARTKFDIEDKFNDSEDEFYASRDKILLEEEPSAKRRRQTEEREKDLQPSDEEVFESSDADDTDDDAFAQSAVASEANSDDEEIWGTTKADYYNADVIETEADAMDEEKEARRLQQKQLKSMTDKDFGFDESMWTASEAVKPGPVVEKLSEAKIPTTASKKELQEILFNRYPEFDLLAKDFVELQEVWNELQIPTTTNTNGVTSRTKLHALTMYLGAIAIYFALITSTMDSTADQQKITALPHTELREHVIMDNLMISRHLWEVVKDVKEKAKVVVTVINKVIESKPHKIKKETPKTQRPREPSFESQQSDVTELPVQQQKKKAVDLQTLLAQSVTPQVEESDFGDEEPLTEFQAAEKAKKKKSLRFYTAQIAQKANKRGAASREAGGDDDVPHKERLRDKQERLLKQAERRGQEEASGREALGDDSDDVSNADGNEYYQSLVTKSKQKKDAKAARAEAYAEAARQGAYVYEEEQIGADGKRKITYAIEKNKGLAPKRKKDVRNPRVKKRKKFDEKMKKLGSIRQVYKGGEGKGGYGGELTGIKTNVVKSVKL